MSTAATTSVYARASQLAGAVVAWLAYVMAAITGLVVVMRYLVGEGSIALQEAVTWCHAALFMLGAAYALRTGAHVRVDVLYVRLGPVARAWVDCIGAIVFLLPMCIFITWVSLDYVYASWLIRETSADPGGLGAVYLLKLLIPVMGVMLVAEGVARLGESTRRLLDLLGPSGHG